MIGLQTFGLWALAFMRVRAPAPCATLAGHGGRFQRLAAPSSVTAGLWQTYQRGREQVISKRVCVAALKALVALLACGGEEPTPVIQGSTEW